MKKQSIFNSVRGFTLIEILIVVAIIAILASSVLVGFGPAQRQGRDSRRISDLRQVQNALELYYAKCGYYPGPAQAGSGACSGFSSINTWAALEASIAGSNLGISATNIPNDPTSGKDYLYGTNAGGSSYTLGAYLEDTRNPALQSGPQASSNGVPCTGATNTTNPVYCIEF